MIEELIKKGRLSEYIKGGKWDRVGCPKTKSPTKVFEVGPSSEKGETNKGKHPYTAAISGGATREILLFKGTVKSKFIEMMALYNNKELLQNRPFVTPILQRFSC